VVDTCEILVHWHAGRSKTEIAEPGPVAEHCSQVRGGGAGMVPGGLADPDAADLQRRIAARTGNGPASCTTPTAASSTATTGYKPADRASPARPVTISN
jgi:hypothetical protein